MVQAGFTLVGKREMRGGFGAANCEANRHLLGNTWRTEAVDHEDWSPVDADVVFGNPPCSGFSVMSAKDFRGADSKINHCMWAFVDYAAKVRPYVAVFESVQNAFTSPDGHALMLALRARLEDRTGHVYTLHHVRHNAIAVGGAAVRRRYFWLATRVPFGVERETRHRYPILNDVIGDLDNLAWTWQKQPYRTPASWWATDRRSASGAVDGHYGLDNPLTRRIRDLLEAVPWLPGEHIGLVAQRHWDQYAKLPDSWSASEEKIVKNEFNMGFTTPTRWNGDGYGRVVTGAGLVNIVHPYLNRTLTHREVARVLGFPDDWRILPLRGVGGLNLTWGKGITVDCGRWIGRWLKAALDGSPGSYAGKEIGDREFDIDLTNDYPKVPGAESPSTRRDLILSTYRKSERQKESNMSTETGEAPAAAAARGRPRPQATIDRDARALEIVTAAEAGVTRDALATALSVTGPEAYLSLYRLRADGKVVREGNTWKAVVAA
jgi:site-specific DNA-cytosine methylase